MLNQTEALERILVLFNICIVGLCSLLVCAWAVNVIDIENIQNLVHSFSPISWRILVILFTSLLLLANIVYVKQECFEKYETQLLVQDAESKMIISLSAIEDSLERAAKQIPEIQDVRVNGRKRIGEGTPLEMRVTYATWEDTVVSDVIQKLQSSLQVRYEQIAGSSIAPHFELVLAKIVEKSERRLSLGRSSPEGKGEDKPDEPHTRPFYPIDGSSDSI